MILNNENRKKSEEFFREIIGVGLDFKLQKRVRSKNITEKKGIELVAKLPDKGKEIKDVLDEFKKNILPYCTNFSSNNFMGFPDSGNSVAAIGGALMYNFLQQNLINQSFCGPAATFVDIAVISWLREIVGYKNTKVKDIWDVGGIITPGGTASNSIGILLARENKFPATMENGMTDSKGGAYLVVPKGIGHYSVKSAQMWIGCGNKLLEVETKNFRYDLDDLKKKLEKNKGKIMGLVAYAGDSRTMSVDQFDKIAKIVKSIDNKIWLHADACHGFSLGLSDKLKNKIKGIEKFDSITLDPHKVLMTPYTISAILIKDPEKFKTITSFSDLIMQEKFSFGQITPFLGSSAWQSLKLWFLIKNLGKKKLGEIIEKRCELANYLANKLKKDKNFLVINEVDINSVLFMFNGEMLNADVDFLNKLNKRIHASILKEGKFHLHQFSINDPGAINKGKVIFPLRFMCGNPNTTEKDVDNLIKYLKKVGKRCLQFND